jgi:hypothetical protein
MDAADARSHFGDGRMIRTKHLTTFSVSRTEAVCADRTAIFFAVTTKDLREMTKL